MTHEASQVFPAGIQGEESVAGTAAHVSLTVSRRPFLGFLLTYLLTVGSLVTVGILWDKPGFDMLVVAMGWPHVLLGLAFNLNRLGRADRKAHLFFCALLLITIAIAIGHSLVSITSLIYLYFVVHAFRDEIYIYHQRRSGYRFRGRIFDRNGRSLFVFGAIIALVGQSIPRDPELQLKWYYLQFAIAAVLTCLAMLKRPRRLFEKWPGLRNMLPILLFVIAAMAAMKYLRLNGFPAPVFFAFLVVFHYFSWYVFSLEKMTAPAAVGRSREEGGSLFRWINTRRGFLTVIVVMNVVSFAGAWGYRIMEVSPKLAYGFELKYFLYFLVLHVTTSFVPRNLTRIPAVPARVDWQREIAG
jgi:hypothetical protein